MNRHLYLIGLLGCVLPAFAGESVLLRNGFRLHADRHETTQGTTRLYAGDGFTEMAAEKIEGFETDAPEPVAEAKAQVPAPVIELVVPTPPATPQDLAVAAAQKYSLPPTLVKSVMHTESAFNPEALSPKGAIGLMQLMPGTARLLGADPHDPHQNADAGTRYLHDLLALYEDSPNQVLLALAAYNAGPAAVEKYHGVPPFRETHDYIRRVLKGWNLATAAK